MTYITSEGTNLNYDVIKSIPISDTKPDFYKAGSLVIYNSYDLQSDKACQYLAVVVVDRSGYDVLFEDKTNPDVKTMGSTDIEVYNFETYAIIDRSAVVAYVGMIDQYITYVERYADTEFDIYSCLNL